ncbi:MAG: SPFH domain-containing protein [Chthoniobacteraceae bacterium]|jgi:regulator of protease activity HflC (stomatin/prohibitin superfamily)
MSDHIPFPQPPIARIVSLVVALIVAAALLGLTFSAWRSINPGYVGIVFDKANHKVTTGALDPGWAFINPFTQAIQEYPVTIRTYEMVQNSTEGQVQGDDSIKVQSDEGQQINLDVVIQYQVEKDKASQLYVDWGGAPIDIVEDGVVRQYTRSQVPVVAAKYGWEEITSTKRGEIVQEISDILRDEFDKRHLTLVSFGIREVHLPQSLQDALNQKIQAQQAAEQQKYMLQQAEVKAQQDVAQATGEANSVKARAEGDAQAILTKAKAQAEANDLLAKSLTAPLIQYEQLQRWDGRLPLVTGGAGAIPLLDVSKLAAPAATPAPQ